MSLSHALKNQGKQRCHCKRRANYRKLADFITPNHHIQSTKMREKHHAPQGLKKCPTIFVVLQRKKQGDKGVAARASQNTANQPISLRQTTIYRQQKRTKNARLHKALKTSKNCRTSYFDALKKKKGDKGVAAKASKKKTQTSRFHHGEPAKTDNKNESKTQRSTRPRGPKN